ncbi:MAG: hypothetical protein EOM51_09905, partial [Clostridia bacterium]|nr:hypothetical protein [Clostridia bacterium]
MMGGLDMNKSNINATAAGKKLLSFLMVLCMLLTLLPTAALAADAPTGYTTDSNGIMAYRYRTGSYSTINCINLQGYYDGSWLQTISANMGFETYLEINGGENYRHPGCLVYYPNKTAYVNATGSPETAGISPYWVNSSGLTVDVDTNFLYDGRVIQFQYTVKNTSSSSVTFALGSTSLSCLMLGNTYQRLTVTPFGGGLSFSSGNSDAQLNFWYGSDIEGVTPVDTCWYGYFSDSPRNTFTDIPNKTTLNVSPGLSWSWKNRAIAAGETQTFSVLLSVGGKDSEILTKEYTVDYSTTLGTEPEDVTVEAETSVTLPTLTAAGYEFGGWYSDYALTSPVGAGGESYTPTDSITLYAKWTSIQSPVNVTVTKDSDAWTGQNLALYQGRYYKCALIESGTGGIYSASVVNGTYDIYKDGVDTGDNASVATTATSGTGAAVSVTIGYTTLTAVTKLDGSAGTAPGTADYRTNGAVQLTPAGSGGTYTTIVRDTNSSSYDVYVNALDSDQNISVSDNSVTVNYFTGEVAATLDSAAYAGKNVVLSRTEGNNTYYYTASYQSGGKYTVMLPAGPSNAYTYTVSVDGRALTDTVSYNDKTAAAAYYTAHVDVLKNGSDWTGDGVCVYLEDGGTQQKLTYTDSTDYQLVLFSDGTAYNVLVSGSNSPQDTGFDVSSNAVQAISYWTVNFYTTDDANAYTSRIIQNGKTVSKPSAPNVTGKSFDGWYKTAGRTDTYDYSSAISDTTHIYAKYVDPAVSINDIVMDSSTYTVPNLTITGFPSAGTPVKTAVLTVDSGTVAVTAGSGYTVTGSGSKAVTVTFGNTGTSMANAQAFLRTNTVATPASTSGGGGTSYTTQNLSVTVCGNTSDGSVTTSTTTIFPVTLNLNGGTLSSGSLSYYQEGVGATLPTDVSYSGHTFAGWYDNSECSGSAVTEISDTDSGGKTYYAKWTTSDGAIDFGTPVLNGVGSFTYPNLELTAPVGLTGNLYSVSISIENGTVAVTEGDGYTVGYNLTNTTATINLGAGMSVNNVQNLLRTKASFTGTSSSEYPVVKMTLDGNTTTLPSGDSIFSAGNGTVGLNGHYYMYVPVSGGIDWNSAYNLAKSYTYMGMQGYLVTVTSAAEDTALDQLTTKGGWAGGTRLIGDNNSYDRNPWLLTSTSPYYNNIWKWVCGPEAGTAFYYGSTGESNASAVDGAGSLVANNSVDAVYTHWNPGEPNACDHGVSGGVENTLQIHAGPEGGPYLWNDIPASWNFDGYFVEFGGYGEGVDPGPGDDEGSENITITGDNTVKAYAPTSSGDTIYANGEALIVSGSNAYWDMDSDGVLDNDEDDTAISSGVSSSTTIYAGTTSSLVAPPSGQITVLTDSTVGKIDGGNVSGPVCVNLSGDVDATIDLDNITMVAVTGTLTGDVKLTATDDLGAGRVLAIDKTVADVIDMTKFTLNSGNNAVIAVGKELQISGYGVNTDDSVSTTLTGTAPTYITATVNVMENGSLADAESVVLQSESGTSITLNRSETGVYSYTGLMDNTTVYTLYIDGEAVGSSYAAFASTATTNQAPSYYTAQVTYKVDGAETDAQSVVLKADGKADITLTQQTDSGGDLVTGVYEYRAMADSTTEYAVWVNGEDSGETLKFAGGDYQKTINRYTTEVSLTNSGAWSGQTVTLRDDSGNMIYTLSETDTSGTYSVLTDSDYVGTYNIYINGEDSGTDITPSATAKATTAGAIAYMTAVVTTNKDGTAARLGTVTVGGKSATESSTGNYTINLPSGTYAVSVAGTNVGNVTDVSTSLTANFYTVTYDGNGATGTVPTDNTVYFDGSTVTVLSAGELSKSGNVFAGWKTGETTYDAGEIFAITGATTLTAQWSSSADAEVSWTVDGTTYYGTLSEAIAAAENTGLPVSITIQNNVTITENVTIPDNAAVTVPEGKTVTVAENVTLTNEGTINSNGTITGDGTLDNNGTVDNTAAAETGGTISIATDNSGGDIEGGMIAVGVTVSGGEITGPIVNNGTVEDADVTGEVTNNGTLTDTDVTGDVENNSGAEISGGTINGNVENEGTVESITVNGNFDNASGTVTSASVAGTTTAPGGTITTAAELIAALGGAAHIDAGTGAVVLDGDVELDQTITITSGDIVIDLNGYSITGPSGDSNASGEAEDGGAAII